MKILLVADDMLPGGIARHITDLASGLSQRGHGVVVAATDGQMRKNLPAAIPFIGLSLFDPRTFRKRYVGTIPAYRSIVRAIDEHGIELIHSHHRLSHVIARAAAKRRGIPHIATSHNVFLNLKRLSRFGDETIAVSEVIRRNLLEDFRLDPRHVHVVHLGTKPVPLLSKQKALQSRKRYGFGGKRVIASIGRLEKTKDRLTLLKAIALLKGSSLFDDWMLVIVGDGTERSEIMNTVRVASLGSSVILLDSSTNVADILNVAEFCAISSVHDGGTLYVNLEAASLSKPHVATNVGGIPEFVIDGDTGLLVPPRSPEQLASAIASLIRNPKEVRRLGRNAYRRYVQRHGFDQFIDETLGVYGRVVDSSRPSRSGSARPAARKS